MQGAISASSRADLSRDAISNFMARKNLKDVEVHYEVLKNRIKILEQSQTRNVRKMENSQIRIDKIQMALSKAKDDRKNIQEQKKRRQSKQEEMKKKNRILKDSITKQALSNLSDLHQMKSHNYRCISNQSKENDRKIQAIKRESAEERKLHHSRIVEALQKARETASEFMVRKYKTIHEVQVKQNQALMEKQQKKLADMKVLERRQIEALNKYIESNRTFKCMKERLGEIAPNHHGISDKKKTNQKELSKARSESFYILHQL